MSLCRQYVGVVLNNCSDIWNMCYLYGFCYDNPKICPMYFNNSGVIIMPSILFTFGA